MQFDQCLRRLPFTGCIQGALHEGKTITVTGRVLPGAQRFHVNLQCGSRGNPDVALHFNPRYDGSKDVVICNTMQHSKWGPEEREYPASMTRGANFTLMFLVNRDSYSVIVNGAHFMEYLHRLSFSSVDTISVDGGVEIQSIAFSNPAVTSPPPQPGYAVHPHIVVPYKNIIVGGLYPGRNIIIQGVVNHNADKFCVNLRFNSGVALHFNPRFNENIVVRNSLLKEQWGPEERTGGMPFYRGHYILTSECVLAAMVPCAFPWMNSMFSYNHRHFLLQEIDILEVEGNVSLSSVLV
uniref:Galectin n=1 Tax=Salmo trutta TaxID=8032 RepID=A0A673WV74_SALTR